MSIINVINLKLSITLVFFCFFLFRSIICNDKALYLTIITYILVSVLGYSGVRSAPGESRQIWKIWKKSRLNREKIWKIQKKSKLNNENIWKLWKKGKLNCEKIRNKRYGKVS